MNRLTLFFLLLWPVCSAAKVYYLTPDGVLPPGSISALEVRVSLSSARPGKVASWTLGWGSDSVTVSFDCRNMIDGVGDPQILVKCRDFQASASDMNFNGGCNSLAVEWEGQNARILAGDSRMSLVLEVPTLSRPASGFVSVTATSGKLKINDLIAETDEHDLSALMTDCDTTELDVWEYIDSTESSKAQLGGKYQLGLLKTAEGYDLIYLGGAMVNGAAWLPGMRKASLSSRGFSNHFLLNWIDSTGRQLPGEHYAILDLNESVLTLNFPAFPVTVRFAKRN